MPHTMSFLTSPDDVIDRKERPLAGFSGVELVEGSGVRHAASPRFARMIEAVLRALDEGKVVHVDVEEPLVSPERAAEMLGVSRPTIYAWQDRGRLERVDQGNRRMVPTSDVERYKHEQQERAAWRATIDTGTPDEAAVDAAAETFAGTLDLAKDAMAPPSRPRRKTRRAAESA